LCNWNFLLT